MNQIQEMNSPFIAFTKVKLVSSWEEPWHSLKFLFSRANFTSWSLGSGKDMQEMDFFFNVSYFNLIWLMRVLWPALHSCLMEIIFPSQFVGFEKRNWYSSASMVRVLHVQGALLLTQRGIFPHAWSKSHVTLTKKTASTIVLSNLNSIVGSCSQRR